MADPTFEEDETALAEYAGALADAIAAVSGSWMGRLIESRAPGLVDSAEVNAAIAAGSAATNDEIRTLLAKDIARQAVGPLELLRRAVRFPTALLADAGIPAPARDEFAMRNFPDDLYDLTPASFAAVDPSLHEPGIMWGAAKAHVHLRRRRESVNKYDGQVGDQSLNEADRKVVALSTDVMDRSKITAAFPAATMVSSPAKLVQEAATASLVLVDLARLNDPAALLAIDAPIVAFGSHVNEAELAAATNVGAEALPRSVFFRRLANGDF